jgi:hypothetical protein
MCSKPAIIFLVLLITLFWTPAVRAEPADSPAEAMPGTYRFACQKDGAACWLDTARIDHFSEDGGQKVVSVWVRCIVDPAEREKVMKNLRKGAASPELLEKLAYFEEHYWFILFDPGYPAAKLPVRIVVERLYYDASGSGKTIDSDTVLYRGLSKMRQYYAALTTEDEEIFRLAVSIDE